MNENKHTPGPWVNIGNCRIHGTPAYLSKEEYGPDSEWQGVPGNSLQEVCVAFPASIYEYWAGDKHYPVRKDVQERWWARNKANIDLICAAPDLLEALKTIVLWHVKRGPFDEPLASSEQTPEINLAISAIAKAEGRE